MTRNVISAALHAELSEKLEEQLDALDDLAEAKSAINDAFRNEKKRLASAVSRTRRQLKGQELPQRSIPGTEVPEPRRDPVLLRLIDSAKDLQRELAAKAEKEKAEEKGEGAPPAPAKGEGSDVIAWSKTLDKEGERYIAYVPTGRYEIEAGGKGWIVRWRKGADGKARSIGGAVKLEDAKQLGARHHLEELADRKLENAGAGALVDPSTKGPPTTPKKPRGKK